ncbi:pyridoxamine 5'-phosphate oxidase family protein [Tissierella praeacuta]|uniref:pyridoxamine 5'-phosphate oxidase family protein n=1 Tax=Tissierella praeacuta TaxID=43131 RepID=UPI003340521E
MQHRMKTHPLTKEQIDNLLMEIQTGCLATLNANGFPYVTPIHFLYLDNAIYIHGLPKGQKINNIKANPKVSMTVYEMDSLILDPDGNPCDTNTKYRSVIIMGTAVLLEDMEQKKKVLNGIIEKYTPQLIDKPLPENMIKGTAVMKISINEITGKYY